MPDPVAGVSRRPQHRGSNPTRAGYLPTSDGRSGSAHPAPDPDGVGIGLRDAVVLPVINATVPYHDIVRLGDVMQMKGT